MARLIRPNFLRRLLGLPAPLVRDDPADMGTAIGLEFTLDQPPLRAAPLRVKAHTVPASGSVSAPSWQHWPM